MEWRLVCSRFLFEEPPVLDRRAANWQWLGGHGHGHGGWRLIDRG